MAYSAGWLLEKSIEITKEAAKGGTTKPIEIVLENVFDKLKKLNEKVKSEE